MKIPQSPPHPGWLPDNIAPERLLEIMGQSWGPAPGGKYRHWDTVRRIDPPEGFTNEEYWVGQKLARSSNAKQLSSLWDRDRKPFWYSQPDPLLQMLHQIDRQSAGWIGDISPSASPEVARRWVASNLVQEAITSSQLEGATTTRKVAKEMLRSGRSPVSKGEKMILNNFMAMRQLKDIKDRPLSIELLDEIQIRITTGLLEPDERYRKNDDGTRVYDERTNTVLHDPPHASETPARLQALCDFANEEESEGNFIHPALKAVMLHFGLAYLHPYADGNGRTARALFYWYLLKKGFWLAEYVSISTIIKRAHAKYGRSFLYVETDQNDLTYFLLAQLRVYLGAVENLSKYIKRKAKEYEEAVSLLRPGDTYNHRQIALLTHALRHPGSRYTIESHRHSHGVSYQTARTDLLGLAENEMLAKRAEGKRFAFYGHLNLAKQLEKK